MGKCIEQVQWNCLFAVRCSICLLTHTLYRQQWSWWGNGYNPMNLSWRLWHNASIQLRRKSCPLMYNWHIRLVLYTWPGRLQWQPLTSYTLNKCQLQVNDKRPVATHDGETSIISWWGDPKSIIHTDYDYTAIIRSQRPRLDGYHGYLLEPRSHTYSTVTIQCK